MSDTTVMSATCPSVASAAADLTEPPTGQVGETARNYRGRIKIIIGPMFARKCLGRGTLVVTGTGEPQPVEDIRVGHQVVDQDGVPRDIIGVTRGEANLYRVQVGEGNASESYTVTAEHQLTLEYMGCPSLLYNRPGQYWVIQWCIGHRFYRRRFYDRAYRGRDRAAHAAIEFLDHLDTSNHSHPGELVDMTVVEYVKRPKYQRECYRGVRARPHLFGDTEYVRDVLMSTWTLAECAKQPAFIKYHYIANLIDNSSAPEIISVSSGYAGLVYKCATEAGLVCRLVNRGSVYAVEFETHSDGRLGVPLAERLTLRADYINPRIDIQPCGRGAYWGFEMDDPVGRFVLADLSITHNSSTMLTNMEKYHISRKKCVVIKHSADTRYDHLGTGGSHSIVCHDQREYKAVPVITVGRLEDAWKDTRVREADVIGVSETQFYPDLLLIDDWANAGKMIICEALDGDFGRRPFGQILELIPKCESIKKLTAVCVSCYGKASFTKKISDDATIIDIGGSDKYVPLCRHCYFTYEGPTGQQSAAQTPGTLTPTGANPTSR